METACPQAVEGIASACQAGTTRADSMLALTGASRPSPPGPRINEFLLPEGEGYDEGGCFDAAESLEMETARRYLNGESFR